MPRRSLFALLALLGCTPSEPSGSARRAAEPGPAPTPSEQAPAPTPPPTPAPPEPTPPPLPAAEPPYVATPGLRAVAVREGDIAISNGAILIDGEPLVITAGRVERDPERSRGLEPMLPDEYAGRTLAFAGALAPGDLAAMTTMLEFGRGATQYKVYVHEGERWRRLALERGAIVEYYPSLVERGGALLGLRAYALNPSAPGSDNEENPELEDLFYAAIGRAKPGFVQLAGPKVALPSLPKHTFLAQAVTTTDGTLYAITEPRPKRSYDDDWPDPTWTPALLMWPPDASEPTTLALPDYVAPAELEVFSLSSSGDYALIGTRHDSGRPYLAVARGSSLERVSEGIAVGPSRVAVRSAARAPSGELWVVLGSDEGLPAHPLWKRDSGTQAWSPAHLPKLDDPRVTTRRATTYYDHYQRRFTTAEYAASPDVPATATQVAWLDGAAWIVAELGSELEAANLMMSEVPRSALFTTHPGSAPLLVLPAQDRLTFEQLALADEGRAAKAKPGSEACREVSFVVAATLPSEPDLDGLDRGGLGLTGAQLDALAAIAPIPAAGAREPKDDDEGPSYRDARIVAVYVGELPARGSPSEPLPAREMIVVAKTSDPSQVEPLREAIAKVVEVDVRAECPMRAPLRMLWSLAEDGD